MHAMASLAILLVAQDTWHGAACDERNAFTSVKVPEWMHAWCSGPPLRVGDVRAALPTEPHRLPGCVGGDPLYRRLATVSSHSVRILMPINFELTGRALWSLRLARRPAREEGTPCGADDAAWFKTQGARRDADGSSGGSWGRAALVAPLRFLRRATARVLVVLHPFQRAP